jgi:hypothetical protein
MFIDDCTRMTKIYLLKRKYDVSHIFSIFTNMIKKINLGLALKVLKPIILGITLIKFYHHILKKKGLFINHLVLIPPQQNGFVDRKNRHLLKIT